MLKKIYQELVAIRKELQDIKNILKPNSVDAFIDDQIINEGRIEPGYDEIKSISSDQVVIRFSVPCHGWNELAISKEWKDFQALLEKYQIGQSQKQHLATEYQ